MTVQVFDSDLALAEALATEVIDAVARRPDTVLGLPTGRTPLALYEAIIRRTRRGSVDWSRVRTFNLDEFVGLPPGHPGSYRAFMEARFFRPLGIEPAQVGFLDGGARDLEAECRRYEAAIVEAGGIDILVLGIGVNGHIGFNEPGASLQARTHRVALEERTRAANALWFDGDIARVPTAALSMGMATILAARTIVLVATGEEKAAAVRGMLEGPLTTWLPASFLQLHATAAVMLDREAAAGLSAASAPALS
ncbi:MAG: glucosamine-6-phosphate deaminase [Acidobacteriota bacterium]